MKYIIHSIELGTRKCVQGYIFFSFARNLYFKNYWILLKNMSLWCRNNLKKAVYKTSETTFELTENKIV